MDLLGGDGDVIGEPFKAPPAGDSPNQDLLDLLGLGPLSDPPPDNAGDLILDNYNANLDFLAGEQGGWRRPLGD